MRLKKLGAALVVVAALGAVLASSAFATATTTAEEWNVTGGATSTAVGTATFETEVAGTKYVLESTGIECKECKTENVGGSASGSGKLKFTGVTVKEPAGCSVASSIETTELTVSADYMESEKVYVKFAPTAGETKEFATVAITGCSLATTLVPKGTVFVEAAKKTGELAIEQEVRSSGTINSTAGGSLKVGTKNAVLEGKAKFKLNCGVAFGVGSGGGGGCELWKEGEEGGNTAQLKITTPAKACEGKVRVENVSVGVAAIKVLKETGIECTLKKKGCEGKTLAKGENCESEMEKPGTKPEYELEVEWNGNKFTRKFPA